MDQNSSHENMQPTSSSGKYSFFFFSLYKLDISIYSSFSFISNAKSEL